MMLKPHVKRFRHLSYLEGGSAAAPPLFLLHGGTMTASWNWHDALAAFTHHHRVIAPDTPGHGESRNPRPDLRYGDVAQDVLALADALGIDHAAFYGFSDGAQIALEVAIQEPSFPTTLVLSAVLYKLTPEYRAHMLEFAGAEEFTEPAWTTTQPTLAAECKSRHADWSALAPQVWELWMRPLELGPERLANVATPTLLLTGDRDAVVALEQTVELLRLLPSASLAVIPGAGHDYDQRFTRAALGFLDGHARTDDESALDPGAAANVCL